MGVALHEESSVSDEPAMTPQQKKLMNYDRSPLALYKELSVGRDASTAHFLLYEFVTTVFSGLPGLTGFGARSFFYPALFGSCQGRPGFGRGVVIRRPRAIHLGAKVLVDDYAALDARGDDAEIKIGSCVTIGRFSAIGAKNGKIEFHDGVNVGAFCRIASQSKVVIGESTLVAAYVYIGPGNHQQGNGEEALIEREMEIKGGVVIGKHAWIGTRATILDGVTIGDGAIVGAHSLVREDVPAGAVVAGCPAKILRRA